MDGLLCYPHSCLSHLAVVLVAWLGLALSIYLKRRNAFRFVRSEERCNSMCCNNKKDVHYNQVEAKRRSIVIIHSLSLALFLLNMGLN